MVWRPLPLTGPCPGCGAYNAKPNWRPFKGWRVECFCGMSGPFVSNGERFPEHEAINEWNRAVGYKPKRPDPPSPINFEPKTPRFGDPRELFIRPIDAE